MCSPYGSARSTECDNIRNARRWPSRHAPTISPELHPRQPSFSFLLLLLFLLLPHRRRLASLLTSDRWFTREDLLLARFYERLWPATETRREQRPSLPRTKNRFLRDSAQFRRPSPRDFLGEFLCHFESKRSRRLHEQRSISLGIAPERRVSTSQSIDSCRTSSLFRWLDTRSFGCSIDSTITTFAY